MILRSRCDLQARVLPLSLRWQRHQQVVEFDSLPVSLFPCRGGRRRLLPPPLPALPRHRGDQFGRHRPLLRPGRRPLFRLQGLFQKRRLLRGTDPTRDLSHPALVLGRLVAACAVCVSALDETGLRAPAGAPAASAASWKQVIPGKWLTAAAAARYSQCGANGYYAAKLVIWYHQMSFIADSIDITLEPSPRKTWGQGRVTVLMENAAVDPGDTRGDTTPHLLAAKHQAQCQPACRASYDSNFHRVQLIRLSWATNKCKQSSQKNLLKCMTGTWSSEEVRCANVLSASTLHNKQTQRAFCDVLKPLV